jgi:hypothetical protein
MEALRFEWSPSNGQNHVYDLINCLQIKRRTESNVEHVFLLLQVSVRSISLPVILWQDAPEIQVSRPHTYTALPDLQAKRTLVRLTARSSRQFQKHILGPLCKVVPVLN